MAIVKNDCRDYIDRREYGSCRDWQKNGNIENIETVKNDGNIGTVGKNGGIKNIDRISPKLWPLQPATTLSYCSIY